ncbi:MAG: iron-sulfur cluster assembly scaffold protein [Deltaproteobacteria bacterium]|nr:iron-sulfur cluster assembly scaffold protein [Deltaproteobacteria bacterium]
MGMFDQLKRSFLGSFTGNSGGAPLDPTRPNDNALEAWARVEKYDGVIEDATVVGRHTSPCGDRVSYTMTIEDWVIKDIKFEIKGCVFTRATAAMVAANVQGRTVQQAIEISAGDVRQAIPQIPDDHPHPSILAVMALYKGLSIYSVQNTAH